MTANSSVEGEVSLQDVRILDLSRVLAGPFATQVLASVGADVVKVEFPAGDPARYIGPFLGDRSLYFSSVNTGKRGVVVDPTTPDGRRGLQELIGWADVVVHNFRRQAAEQLALRPDRLLAAHPKLIVVAISGYGSGTTRADDAAYDLTVQAESGLLSVTGHPGGPSVRTGVPVSDLVAGLWAAFAVTTALHTRDRQGHGLYVEVPLLGATLPLLSYMATATLATGVEPGRVGSGHHQLVPYRAYSARDGDIVIAVVADKFWPPLCHVLGLDDLLGRTDLRTVEGRRRHRPEVDGRIEAACRAHTVSWLVASLRAAGVSVARVNSIRQALAEAETGGWVEWVAAPQGRYAVIQGPLRVNTEGSRPAPDLGQHTDEVLGGPQE